MAMGVSYSIKTWKRRRFATRASATERLARLRFLGMIFTAPPIRLRRQVFRKRREAMKASRRDSRETC